MTLDDALKVSQVVRTLDNTVVTSRDFRITNSRALAVRPHSEKHVVLAIKRDGWIDYYVAKRSSWQMCWGHDGTEERKKDDWEPL